MLRRLAAFATAFALAFNATAAYAQESSSQRIDADTTVRVSGTVANKLGDLVNQVEASLQTEALKMTRILNCSKTKRFYNGTTCVGAIVTIVAPNVVVKTKNVEATERFRQKHCCKEVWGVCVRDKHEHKRVYCTESTKDDYSYNPKTNTVTVTDKVCNPRIIWIC